METKKNPEHCKIAIIGNVDSGKSTLVGVLTKGAYDDGRGAARLKVFNYPHEAENGRTSSIAHEIMGFDNEGKQVLPERYNQNKYKYWKDVVENSSKIVTLVDLCGHEKYLKTTMFGLTGLVPDYSMIIVGSNMGISKMTKEHLGISVALKIPFLIVVTKIDICPENVKDDTIKMLKKIIKGPAVNKMPIEISDNCQKAELKTIAENLYIDRVCPIFQLSNVTGQGIKELIQFLGLLNNRDETNNLIKKETDPFEFDIQEHFMVQQVGLVVSGVIKSGTAKNNQIVQLGPDKQKQFKQIVIKSIHVNRIQRETAVAGEFACFGIKPLKAIEKLMRSDFRKGMILLDKDIQANAVYEFEADILVLHHATVIRENYQAVMHCGVIRQAVGLQTIYNQERLLRNGERGLVRLRFMYSPEYIKEGLPVLFREGRTKILGIITRILSEEEVKLENQKNQYSQIPMVPLQQQQNQNIEKDKNQDEENKQTDTLNKEQNQKQKYPQQKQQQQQNIQNEEQKISDKQNKNFKIKQKTDEAENQQQQQQQYKFSKNEIPPEIIAQNQEKKQKKKKDKRQKQEQQQIQQIQQKVNDNNTNDNKELN